MRGKPAGSTVRLPRFKWFWAGEPDEPQLGAFLVSDAGSGYEIVGVEETGRSGPEQNPRIFNLVCVKTEPSEIPVGAMVGSISWDRR